jgi:hypothetical protein
VATTSAHPNFFLDVQAQPKSDSVPADVSKSKKTQRKQLLAEINAVKGLLRAQADAAGPRDGYAVDCSSETE